MVDDRSILVDALNVALATYARKTQGKSLLGRPSPDEEVLGPLAAAIERCSVYKPVAGHELFSANRGILLTGQRLAIDLLQQGESDVERASDWMLRILATLKAAGRLKIVIWGLSVNENVTLSPSSRLMPFERLDRSPLKDRITDRARSLWDKLIWVSERFYDLPGAALVYEIADVPYIDRGPNTGAFEAIWSHLDQASEIRTLLEAAWVGRPLAFGYWFEYTDPDLDLAAWENTISWSMPEIIPRIGPSSTLDPRDLVSIQHEFTELPEDWREDLLRSMRRFTLSLCRHEMIDRVLDLALAFEVLFSGHSDNAPIGWRVSLRAAQLIGGDLNTRQSNRNKINELYKLRNRGTHGSSLKASESEKHYAVLIEATDIYRILIRCFLGHGKKPDWSVLDLEPAADRSPQIASPR
jgi:hypothetical protein